MVVVFLKKKKTLMVVVFVVDLLLTTYLPLTTQIKAAMHGPKTRHTKWLQLFNSLLVSQNTVYPVKTVLQT